MAVVYTKLHDRLLRPLMAAREAQAPGPSAAPCTPSTSTSMTTSAEYVSAKPRENVQKLASC
jgi:hypothetical protein